VLITRTARPNSVFQFNAAAEFLGAAVSKDPFLMNLVVVAVAVVEGALVVVGAAFTLDTPSRAVRQLKVKLWVRMIDGWKDFE